MTLISAPLAVTLAALGGSAAATALWLKRRRSYSNAQSVAQAYDRWTSDQLLENLWGDHIHLGYYASCHWWREDFRQAKGAFVHELVRWSGLDQLPPGSKVLDVGCGIGGSAASWPGITASTCWASASARCKLNGPGPSRQQA